MKKNFTLLFATAVAAIAMVSCQKTIREEIGNETSESSIHFYAEKIQTKTEFGALSAGEYPTLWTDTKGIKISYNKKTSVEATVTPKDGNTKADFTPASAFSDDGSGSHVFYAMSPSTAQAANISSSYYSWRFRIPTTQTPLAGSVDEGAQIIYAKHDAGATFPTSVGFNFNHVTAYGKLSFSNLTLDGDENVTSITLTASKNWVGEWYYYVATKDPNTEGEFREASASKKITLNTDRSTNIWFACAPVDLSDGGTIDINIFTNKGVYSRTVTFPVGKGNFTAGHVGTFTVNMSGIPRAAMVNNIAAIKALYTSSDVPFVADLTDALVTIVSGNNFYMQDATGGILGFTAGHGLAVGDKLNGTISGTVTKYQGNFEITGFDNSATKTTGNAVTPETVAHSTLVYDFDDYESEYVKVEGLTVSAIDGDGKTITVSDNANLKIYNASGETITVGTQMNAVGVAAYYNSTKEVKIYTLADADLIKIGSVINATDKAVDVGSTISIGATTNSSATITYESANTSIATVDDSGVITGVAAGSTTITCSVAASGKYLAASKVINVTVSAGSNNTWTRVTSVAQITSGGTFVIGYENTANSGILIPMRQEDAGASKNYIRSGTTSGSSTNGTITMTGSMSPASTADYEAVIVAGLTSGNVSIKVGTKFIQDNATASDNKCTLSSTQIAATDFVPTIGSNDVVTFTSTRTVTKSSTDYNPKFQFNNTSGSYRFTCYTTGAQKNLVLYKKN